MRKALVVGINYYENGSELYGCVNDAHEIKNVLERNSDGTVNFSVKLLTAPGTSDLIKQANLRQQIKDLFAGESETALFYFAGHGHIEETGGYIITSDSIESGDGIPLSDVITWANNSDALKPNHRAR